MKALQVSINGEVIGVFVPPEGPFLLQWWELFPSITCGRISCPVLMPRAGRGSYLIFRRARRLPFAWSMPSQVAVCRHISYVRLTQLKLVRTSGEAAYEKA